MKTYSVHKLCRLAGVTRKTLRVYEEKGLVTPMARGEGDYRYYDERAVARLYEVLALKAMGYKLSEIQLMLDDPSYDRRKSMENQIEEMERQKAELDMLIGFAKTIVAYGLLPLPRIEEEEYPLSQFLSEYVEASNYDELIGNLSEQYNRDPKMLDGLVDEFEGLLTLYSSGESPDSKVTQMKVRSLRKYIYDNVQKYPIDGFRMYAESLVSGGTYDEMLRKDFSPEAICFAAEAMRIYCDRVERKRGKSERLLDIMTIFKEDRQHE